VPDAAQHSYQLSAFSKTFGSFICFGFCLKSLL
jgi:hypothetical protein